MSEIKLGRCKVKAIMGSQQYGLAGDKETPQIAIDVTSKDWGGNSMTTFLYFSSGAAKYSFDRLWALGWKGKTAADLGNMTGIDANEVDFNVFDDEYEQKVVRKGEILMGPGRVTIEKTIAPDAFAARVAALVGNAGAGGATEPQMGKEKLPF